jgi:hypothetical protein
LSKNVAAHAINGNVTDERDQWSTTTERDHWCRRFFCFSPTAVVAVSFCHNLKPLFSPLLTMSIVSGMSGYGALSHDEHSVDASFDEGGSLFLSVNCLQVPAFWAHITVPEDALSTTTLVILLPKCFKGRFSDTGKTRVITLDEHGRLVVKEATTDCYVEIDISQWMNKKEKTEEA